MYDLGEVCTTPNHYEDDETKLVRTSVGLQNPGLVRISKNSPEPLLEWRHLWLLYQRTGRQLE